jgi:hypothetical protein
MSSKTYENDSPCIASFSPAMQCALNFTVPQHSDSNPAHARTGVR